MGHPVCLLHHPGQHLPLHCQKSSLATLCRPWPRVLMPQALSSHTYTELSLLALLRNNLFSEVLFFSEQWTSEHFPVAFECLSPTHMDVSPESSVHHVSDVFPQGICLHRICIPAGQVSFQHSSQHVLWQPQFPFPSAMAGLTALTELCWTPQEHPAPKCHGELGCWDRQVQLNMCTQTNHKRTAAASQLEKRAESSSNELAVSL